YQGELKIGHNVEIGYFAQNQELLLDEAKTVFETIDDIAVGAVRTKVRDILGAFMFSGESIDKKVQVLSGGERARLAIAQLLLKPYNLLILDEPTNHLDIASKDILKRALQNYDGTIILVSHDRYFLEDLPNKVYEFTNKKVKLHLDSVAHILQNKIELQQKINLASKKSKSSEIVVASDSKKIYQLRKEHDKLLRKTEREIEQLENNIELADSKISELEAKLSQNTNESNVHEISKEYNQWKIKSKESMEKWELLHEKLENIAAKRP
ncbi:MAG: ABC-F family ATP-binding cassette domain-containing protein, partial [Bacteroidales bacterium]|nr:ABC-F family ATP-binding cassette domain-containing protein [Bacteroidales bacterium]